MLVITRKIGEGIILAEDTKITILEVGKDRVRIGIDAPKDVKIVREELFDTEKQNVVAANALPKSVMEQPLNNSKE